MRTMKLVIDGMTLYESFFDPKTGNIIRQTVETADIEHTDGVSIRRDPLPYVVREVLRSKYPNRYGDFPSPSPETVDISITNRCNFGCPYCLAPETPILGADLIWRPLSTVKPGEALIGFDEFATLPGIHRKLKPTIVEVVRYSKQPVFRIITETRELKTTGNHGWLCKYKGHVWRSTSQLKLGETLSYFGEPFIRPERTQDYMLGYLTGVTLGDGTFRFEPGWRNWAQGFPQAYWRVAMKDEEALGRIVAFLSFFGVESAIRPFDGGPRTKTSMQKVEIRAIPKLEVIAKLLRTTVNSAEYRRGWLAGFFDAEGSHNLSLRYSQKAIEPLYQVVDYARSLGFEFTIEPGDQFVSKARLVGSVYDRIRFLGVIQPAITRKTVDWLDTGMETKPDRILAIEKAGYMDVVDIQTTSSTFFASGLATHNCYQDSKPRVKHGQRDLVAAVLTGFKMVPYQVAVGGGEPTLHPDLVGILKDARDLGTVPNYTTNGQKLSQEVIKATNDLCGGVAMTYHTHKGFDWFRKHYKQLRDALTCQVNVHLITDNRVVGALDDLIRLQDEMNRVINLVLLAYHPSRGRATLDRMMRRTTYHKVLPSAIKRALGQGMGVAFGEGLLPFFLSRPEIGVNTKFAIPAEGRFSCYVNSKGFMYSSSFDKWPGSEKTVFKESSQNLWDNMYQHSNYKDGEACSSCPYETRCSTPNDTSYFVCARAPHNKLPLESPLEPEPNRKSALDRLLEE